MHVDDHIVIVDKPSGLLSVPGRGADKATCAQSIASARHGAALVVHRLDMDTSGIMVFARHPLAQRRLSQSFEARRTHKVYEALVEGEPNESSGRIDLAIARFSHQRPLRHLDPDGQSAVTHWRAISRHDAHTRLELVPETGRSHQLRLHLSAIGHPILGDPFYGNRSTAPRLCLHARLLEFPHPETGNPFAAETKTPF